jgi:DNA-binding LytR/AlgR family response regulator
MNCIIIDDEPLAREGMLLLLQNIPDIEVLGVFNSAKKASAFMEKEKVNLIFLDIHMPAISGLEFALYIPKETLIIFVTAYTQYAIDSYEFDAIDYLIKPVNKTRLEKAVKKAFTYHSLVDHQGSTESICSDFVLIKADRRYHKIFFQNILYIQGLKDYVIIFLEGKKIITSMNLKTIHGYLQPNKFCRVSKSFLVNINHIDCFDHHNIYIQDAEIPIGDVFRKDFLELYLGGGFTDKL